MRRLWIVSRYETSVRTPPVLDSRTRIARVVAALSLLTCSLGACASSGHHVRHHGTTPTTVRVVLTLPPLPGAAVVPQPFEFGAPDPGATRAFRGTVYWLREGACLQTPDSLAPITTFYTPRIDVPMHDFHGGFPGVPSERIEWFQISYEGGFAVRTAGTYRMRIRSDDGARVFVDDREVVNNGVCAHGESDAEALVDLASGEHRIRVDYFQGPGAGLSVRLFWTPPGGGERVFDTRETL